MGLARRKSELWAEQRPKELEFMFTERRRPVGETHDESCQAARPPPQLALFGSQLPTLPQSTRRNTHGISAANRPFVVGQFPLLGANSTKSQAHQFQHVHQISPGGEFSFVPTSPTGWRVQQIYSCFKRVTVKQRRMPFLHCIRYWHSANTTK